MTRPRARVSAWLWLGLTIGLGILAARLPLTVFSSGLLLVGLLLAAGVEPVLSLVLMLCLAPLKTLIATESQLSFPVDIGQLSLALVMVTWAVWRVTQRRFVALPSTRVVLPLIGIMIAFSPSLFSAASVSAWLTESLKWVAMIALVLVVLDWGRAGRWTWIVFGVVLAAVLQAIIGVYEFRGGSGAPHLWVANYRYFRAFGTFGQPNPFSAFMGLSLPLALGMAWGYAMAAWEQFRGPARQLVGTAWLGPGLLALMYGAAGLVLLAGLVTSWGRGAWLGFGAAGMVMVCFAPRRRWQGVLLLALTGLMFVIVWWAGYVPPSIQQRVDNTLNEFVGFRDVRGVPISDENFAIVERLAHWQAALSMANDHPWIGVGLGNYEIAYPDYRVPSWPRALGHAHNDYLNLLAETGVIGLAGYLVGWGAIVYWTVCVLSQADVMRRGLALGLLGTWTHLAMHSLVDKLYVNNLFFHIGVMLGLLAVVLCSVMDREHGTF